MTYLSTQKLKQFSILIGITCLVTLGGLGCKGLDKTQQAAVKPITLNYWTVYNDVDALKGLAKQYKQLHPYVTVNIRQIRYEEYDSLLTNALADDVGPDIISTHTRWLKKYASRLSPMPSSVKVANLTVADNFSKDQIVTIEQNTLPSLSKIKKEYIATVQDDIQVDGDIYGLPIAADTLGIFYNKKLLDKAGIPVPPATWDEFTKAVSQSRRLGTNNAILQAGVALGTGNNITNSDDIIALLMLQNGQTIIEKNRVTFTNGLGNNDRHPSLEALRFYTDFAQIDKDVYTWSSEQPNAFDEFTRGKSVFYVGYAFDLRRIRAANPQLDFGVLPVPQLNEQAPSNIANYWIETVVKKSKHPDEAWDFIRFLSLPENIKTYTDKAQLPSPLRIHITEQQENELLAPFASQILTAQNWYRGNQYDAAKKAFADLANAYLLPVPDKTSQQERNINLLINTAKIIQQTL